MYRQLAENAVKHIAGGVCGSLEIFNYPDSDVAGRAFLCLVCQVNALTPQVETLTAHTWYVVFAPHDQLSDLKLMAVSPDVERRLG